MIFLAVALLSLVLGAPVAGAASDNGAGITSASGCLDAHGPGTWNKHCIVVEGSGLDVASVEGHLNATVAPYFPADICGVHVKVWGTELGGYYFERSQPNNGCALGTLGVRWNLNMKFQPGSQLCAQTSYAGRVPGPVCVQIRY
ncbi:hypothetical protein P3102_20755 [Amycolatopsis sp. QT-25]|uniref:hypothetical protein n=1 Tax=Amycolatopsis sp. QT-25 TaxID=3034022 RepID=UPI0023EAE622|nr:hypothetical protein [Amycolatopsis sp. QT-25]WET76556.1 hypothetical protein P3102_20755 [Amycolatopsis sp. QT-25]